MYLAAILQMQVKVAMEFSLKGFPVLQWFSVHGKHPCCCVLTSLNCYKVCLKGSFTWVQGSDRFLVKLLTTWFYKGSNDRCTCCHFSL